MIRKYREWERGEFVLIACDTSWGGGDYSTAQFLSKTKLDVPLVYHSKVTTTEMTPEIHRIAEEISVKTGVRPVVCFEQNNGGTAELARLARLNRDGMYTLYLQKSGAGTVDGQEQSEKYGFNTNSATRPAMLTLLKEAIDNQLIKIYDKPTINEMFAFIVKPTGKAEAEQGAHDDLIMSLAIAWQMYQTEHPPIKKNHRRTEHKRLKFHI